MCNPEDLVRSRQDLIRVFECHTRRVWTGRWQRTEERRASIIQLPAQEHGIVLMHGVMAVLHGHAAPIAELHGKRNAAVWPQTVNILTTQLRIRDRDRGAEYSPREDLTFLKVDVDRVVPSAAAVHQMPYLTRAKLWRG